MTGERFRRSDEAIFSAVGADVVALHVANGRCYGMEEVTAAIWNLLDEPRSIAEICERLMELYEIDPVTCSSDVQRLMRLLDAERLVHVARDRDGEAKQPEPAI